MDIQELREIDPVSACAVEMHFEHLEKHVL